VTSLSHFYLSGDSRPYRKALQDFADSTLICKGMMAVAPGSLMQEIADFSLLYPLQVLNYYTKGLKMFRQNYFDNGKYFNYTGK